jgi:hypothetical protein
MAKSVRKSFNTSDSKTGRAARIELESDRANQPRDQVWEGATEFKNSATPAGESAVARKQRGRGRDDRSQAA